MSSDVENNAAFHRLITRHPRRFASSLIMGILAGVVVQTQEAPAANLDPLAAEVSRLAAPCYPIPLEVVRPMERRLPSGDVDVEKELKWRVLYGSDSTAGRAAGRVVSPRVAPEQLEKFIEQIEAVDDTEETRLPDAAELQNPRSVPALRRALDRLKTPMKRLFVLQSLYACGDWNHPDELIGMIRAKTHDTAAFELLAMYHPREATQVSLELLDLAGTVQYGLNKRRSEAMVTSAITTLDRLNHPNLDEVYLAYFKKWPAPMIARKFGDRRTAEAEPLVRKALADAPTSPFFNNFKSIMSYRYALAQMGDRDSMNWMLEKAQELTTAPDYWTAESKSPDRVIRNSASVEWEKRTGITTFHVRPFCDLLVKLNKQGSLTAYIDLLMKEGGNRSQSSISPASLYLVKNEAVVEALEPYFERHGAREKKMGLTEPKKVLALYPNNHKAMKLLEEFVPEKEKRDDLLSLAKEFGVAGLDPNATPLFGRENRE